jgi:hypothetical protein
MARRARAPAGTSIELRRVLPAAMAIVVVLASCMVTATSGGISGLETFLIGAGLCLIGGGIVRQRAWPIIGGGAALFTSMLATAAAGPIEWESLCPLPLRVLVVDANTRLPIGRAEVAISGSTSDGAVVVDRGRTDEAGKRRLYAQVRLKLGGTLYENFLDPRIELDWRYLAANLGLPDHLKSLSIDGWNVIAEADGYEPLSVRLDDRLPKTSSSIDPELPEITLPLARHPTSDQ